MARFKLTIEYDGSPFVGWQRQDNGLGVQEVVETAITSFCGENVRVFAAGRTDTGVHATGQVAHIDLEKDATADVVRNALNYHMKPHPVSIIDSEEVDEDFHARFSATGRAYVYKIINRRSPLTFLRGYRWWVPAPLDADAMHEAAQRLVGYHDFSSFRAAQCQSDSPVKTLDRLDVVRDGEEISLYVEARSFLHHQVRNFAGTLQWVGDGKWTADDVTQALEAKDRCAGGPTAPPDGLFLSKVTY